MAYLLYRLYAGRTYTRMHGAIYSKLIFKRLTDQLREAAMVIIWREFTHCQSTISAAKKSGMGDIEKFRMSLRSQWPIVNHSEYLTHNNQKLTQDFKIVPTISLSPSTYFLSFIFMARQFYPSQSCSYCGRKGWNIMGSIYRPIIRPNISIS